MDALDAIFTRRSIRKYTDAPLSEEQIETLLRAGMAAPSAGNQQPWEFIVLDDRATLNAVPEFHPHARMLQDAAAAIVVAGDETRQKFSGYWVQDCSAAIQNILLAAHALGLGAVWLGIYPREERVTGLKQLLALPTHVTPLGIVSLGYPAESKTPAERFDPSRVHRNRW